MATNSSENLGKRSRLLVVLVAMLFCVPAMSYDGLERLRFHSLSLQDGLSQSTVYSLAQDLEGYLWIGTQEGLNRYDGYEFRVYRRNYSKPNSLAHNYVRGLAVDSKGNLWVGTEEGLQQLEPETDSFKSYPYYPADETYRQDFIIENLWVDRLDNLWMLTRDQVLRHLNPQTRELTLFTDLIASDDSHLAVTSFYADPQGSVWVGTEAKGLFEVDPERMQAQQRFEPKIRQEEHAITAIARSPEGQLWLGVDHWVYGLDEDLRVVFRLTLPTGNRVRDPKTRLIQFDDKGRLLLGTEHSGLYHLDPQSGSFQHYKEDLSSKFGLISNEVFAMIRDQGGLFWLGTHSGLVKLDLNQTSFRVINQSTNETAGLDHPSTYSIFEEKHGDLWVGTKTGLNRMDPDSNITQVYLHDPDDPSSLGKGRIRSVLVDSENRLWVGSQGGGLNLLNRSTNTFLRLTHNPNDATSLVDDRVRYLYEDSLGRLWVATLGGLSRKMPNRYAFVNFSHDPENPESLSFNRVLALVEDPNNGMWVGTSRGLNLLLSAQKFRRFMSDSGKLHSLTENAVSAFHLDKKGTLYIGTLGGGVNILDTRVLDDQEPVFRHLTTAEGLPNDVINGILPDDEGNLWISTNFGVARFNPENYQVKHYDPADGLQGYEFNVGAYALGSHGELYFGGTEGLNIIIPQDVTNIDFLPPLVITSYRKVKQDGRMVAINSWQREVRMDPEDRLLQLNFAALDYSAPMKNQYAYRLDDGAWIYLENRNDLTIPILGSGSYQLQIKGSNHDGLWNEEGIAVSIVIPPPFWQTWWAFFLYGLLIIGLIWLSHYGRLRAVQHRQRELEMVVSERTKQLRHTKQELLDAAHKAGMAEMATNVLHDIGNSMNTVNTSVNLIEESLLRNKTLFLLGKLADMLHVSKAELYTFLTEDKHGTAFPSTMRKLVARLMKLETRMTREITCLRDEVNRIVTVIRAQEKLTHMKETVEEVQLAQFLDDVVESMKGRLLAFDFKLELPEDEHLTLAVPRNRLQRVLISLLENACDALKDNTSQGSIALRLKMDDDMVMLEVEDNGIGIEPDDMNRIFNQGYSTKKGAEGYGLHYAANTIKEMNGRLLVSSPGRGMGTTFTLMLPRRDEISGHDFDKES